MNQEPIGNIKQIVFAGSKTHTERQTTSTKANHFRPYVFRMFNSQEKNPPKEPPKGLSNF